MTKIIVLGTISVLTLFAGFFNNFWGVTDSQTFENHNRDMESFIVGRMIASRQDGIFSSGGLTGIGSPTSTPALQLDDPFNLQYQFYFNNRGFEKFSTYASQIGGQGILFSIFDQIIEKPAIFKLNLFHAFNSLLSAIAITAIIIWFYLEFGIFTALVVLISAIFSQWLVIFGRNLWWSFWAFYLPMIVVMYYFRNKNNCINTRLSRLGLLVFLAVLTKCIMNSYEYISTTLIMMATPLVYYSVLRKVSIPNFIKQFLIVVFSSIAAIIFSMVVLSIQISSQRGHFLDGVIHIIKSFEKRTYGGPIDFQMTHLLSESLEAKTTEVVMKYFEGLYFDSQKFLSGRYKDISYSSFNISYLDLILFFLLFSGLLLFIINRKNDKTFKYLSKALITATWFSIMAPLSWFIIFKAHSYIHLHMNFIAWQMPFTFFGFALIAFSIKSTLLEFV